MIILHKRCLWQVLWLYRGALLEVFCLRALCAPEKPVLSVSWPSPVVDQINHNPLSTDAFFQILWEFAVCNEHWISAAATLPFYPVVLSSWFQFQWGFHYLILSFNFNFSWTAYQKGPSGYTKFKYQAIFSQWSTETTMDKYSAVKTKRWSEKVNMSERERRWVHLLLNWFFIMVFGCN